MILTEIIQTQKTIKNIDQHDTEELQKIAKTDHATHGSQNVGYWGKYRKKTNDLKMGTKESRRTELESNDAYYIYINAVSNLASSNPHYPRVYSIDTVKDANDKITYKIDIEHLKPLNSISKEELYNIAKQLFTEVKVYGFDMKTLGLMVRDSLYDGKRIRDESFSDAIGLITSLMKKYDFINDINWKNLMIRRTNLGYQLVITDPLSQRVVRTEI